MKTRNLIYLAQLEEYDPIRIENWLKKNPNKTVIEIKNHLHWTPKTTLIFLKTSFLGTFIGNKKALFLTFKLLSPIDNLIKTILVFLSTIKFKIFNKNTIVIGITGSWGKTTTKEVIYSILKSKENIVYTPSNHNTLLSIAKQALFLPPKTKIFICEIGAYQIGDIQKVCQIINPKIGILTAVGPMHLERFGNLKNILKTKMELAQSLPKNGTFIYPKEISSQVKNFSLPQDCFSFKDYSEIYNYLGKYFNIPQNNIKKIIDSIPSIKHRLQIIQNGPITVIDDTYNSNPAGFKAALEKLQKSKTKQKILVTPGMIELGNMQFSENEKIAKLAGKICDHIIIVGETNKEALLSGFKNSKAKIHTIKTLSETDQLLPKIYQGTATVLFENDLSDQYF
ncbi:MAG: Mur ligase family protein [Candidatus Shapirobacteria bacterium]|nr:Mur ligase family protein [Candidatus Shapirobacteria bacterium]